MFCTDDRLTAAICGLSYIPRVGAAVFERDGYFVPVLVFRRADVKHGEDARKRDEEAGVDKMPCGKYYRCHVRGSFVLWRLSGLKVFREANTFRDDVS